LASDICEIKELLGRGCFPDLLYIVKGVLEFFRFTEIFAEIFGIGSDGEAFGLGKEGEWFKLGIDSGEDTGSEVEGSGESGGRHCREFEDEVGSVGKLWCKCRRSALV
jgi:hypothetical protein